MRAVVLDRDFYRKPTLELCRDLLGCELVHGETAGLIVEVEAYMGPDDRAAHSYGGRRTKRTRVMFGPPGFAYVYISYGIHHCFNVVSGEEGKPEAILIRSLEPTRGLDIMRERRGRRDDRDLTNGPGKLCQAMGISLAQYGWDLTKPPFFLRPGLPDANKSIACGPRIGIESAGEARHYPWRFWLEGNPFVSR